MIVTCTGAPVTVSCDCDDAGASAACSSAAAACTAVSTSGCATTDDIQALLYRFRWVKCVAAKHGHERCAKRGYLKPLDP